MKLPAQELKHALQLLALPVTAQMRLDVGARHRVRVMAHMYQYRYRACRQQTAETLTLWQAAILADLDKLLAQMTLGDRPPVSAEADLRRSSGWRQVRRIAREALVALDWSLDLPPADAGIYRTLKGEDPHGRWALCRQTSMVAPKSIRGAAPWRVVADLS